MRVLAPYFRIVFHPFRLLKAVFAVVLVLTVVTPVVDVIQSNDVLASATSHLLFGLWALTTLGAASMLVSRRHDGTSAGTDSPLMAVMSRIRTSLPTMAMAVAVTGALHVLTELDELGGGLDGLWNLVDALFIAMLAVSLSSAAVAVASVDGPGATEPSVWSDPVRAASLLRDLMVITLLAGLTTTMLSLVAEASDGVSEALAWGTFYVAGLCAVLAALAAAIDAIERGVVGRGTAAADASHRPIFGLLPPALALTPQRLVGLLWPALLGASVLYLVTNQLAWRGTESLFHAAVLASDMLWITGFGAVTLAATKVVALAPPVQADARTLADLAFIVKIALYAIGILTPVVVITQALVVLSIDAGDTAAGANGLILGLDRFLRGGIAAAGLLAVHAVVHGRTALGSAAP